MFGKRKFNELFDEFDSFFNEIKPTYYKVGPNGYIFYYDSKSTTSTTDNNTNQLKKELDNAILEENFELAVELRDKIKNLEKNGKEIKDLKEKLSISITEENFEESIKIRDKIKNLIK